MGIDLHPRTIRLYLLQLDDDGFTRLVSRRRGREITELGRTELLNDPVGKGMSTVATTVDALSYQMDFDLATGAGTVIVNVSLVDPVDLAQALKEIQLVMDRKLAAGSRIAIAGEGERLGDVLIPEGAIGIGTICSMTVNGVLQRAGIPMRPRFGGLLEIRDRSIVRFVNMIEYQGSTLEPLEIFMRANMTSVRDVVLRGSGIALASFREVPSAAIDHVEDILRKIAPHGIGGVLVTGKPGQALFGIPVSEGHAGIIVAGGLNLIAAVREKGIRVTYKSMGGLADLSSFGTIREAMKEARK
jgi:repressor of nif and glnA expression